jgi:hypothetical protein
MILFKILKNKVLKFVEFHQILKKEDGVKRRNVYIFYFWNKIKNYLVKIRI